MKLIHDKRYGRKVNENGGDASGSNNLPPYVRKSNKRFKLIYESMHKNPQDDKINNVQLRSGKKQSARDSDSKDVYGYFQKYQQQQNNNNYLTNEIPEYEVHLDKSKQQQHNKSISKHKQYNNKHKYNHHHSQHHHHRRNQHLHRSSKIKKLRARPEAGIMQKKIKI
jgi:hypothetical protein